MNPREYFEKCSAFFTEFDWIYNFHQTRIFINNDLERIPKIWIETFEDLPFEDVNDIACVKINPEWPEMLKCFLNQCDELVKEGMKLLHKHVDKCSTAIDHKDLLNVSDKKQHEVTELVKLFNANNASCQYMVDVGCGSGYLDVMLHKYCNMNVLGIDTNTTAIESANQRKKESFELECNGLEFQPLTLTSHNQEVFAQIVKSFTNLQASTCSCKQYKHKQYPAPLRPLTQYEPFVFVIGLHCCGDLTPDVLKIFVQNPQITNLLIFPCCYHKMKKPPLYEDHKKDSYYNFPLSKTLNDLVCGVEEKSWIGTQLLRLSAQEAPKKWGSRRIEDHLLHSKFVVYRAALQLLAEEEKIELKKQRRHGVLKDSYSSIETYIDSAVQRYNVPAKYKSKLQQLIISKSQYCNLVEKVSALQACLQPIAELFLLADRVIFLRECSCIAHLVKVFEDSKSPRNTALYASKPLSYAMPKFTKRENC